MAKVTAYIHKPITHFQILGDLYPPRRPFELQRTLLVPTLGQTAVLGVLPRCRLSGSSNTTQRLHRRHPTPNTQRPRHGPCHPTPNRWSVQPNAQIRKHPTPNIEHPTPKKISSAPRYLLIYGVLGPRWDPLGSLGGRRRLGALVPSLLGPAAARWGSAAGWGSAARSRRGVPARAARNRRPESDPTPFWVGTRKRPCRSHPTPKSSNDRPRLALRCSYRNDDGAIV